MESISTLKKSVKNNPITSIVIIVLVMIVIYQLCDFFKVCSYFTNKKSSMNTIPATENTYVEKSIVEENARNVEVQTATSEFPSESELVAGSIPESVGKQESTMSEEKVTVSAHDVDQHVGSPLEEHEKTYRKREEIIIDLLTVDMESPKNKADCKNKNNVNFCDKGTYVAGAKMNASNDDDEYEHYAMLTNMQNIASNCNQMTYCDIQKCFDMQFN